MKKILLLALLTMGLVYANLPPTSSKGSGESGYSTTFQTDYDSIPVTRSGINVKIGTIPTSKGGTGNTATPSNGQLLVGNGSGFTLATVTGTANQVNVTNGSGSITLSTPQNIATNSNVQFANLTATGTTTLATSLTGPLKGTSGVVSASAINLTSEVTGVLPVANGGTGSGTQNFVDLTNTQTAAGVKTFSSGIKTDSIQTTGSSGVELKNSGGTLVATFGPTNTTNVSMAGGLNVSGAITAGSYSNNLSAFASTTSSQLAGVISDETGSGSLVFGTTPTFTTNLTAPLLIGGTGTTSTLTYKTTSGVGVTGADHIFQVGNNGATEAMRIQNNGNIGIGTASPNANALVDISSTTKAFMPPRMTTTQKNAIASPAAGMVVFDTTLNNLQVYTGSAWAYPTTDAASFPGATLGKIYVFDMSNAGVVSSETGDLVNGNCSLASNDFTCTFNSGKFSTMARCFANVDRASDEGAWATVSGASTSGVIISTQNSGGAAARATIVICIGY